MTDAGLKHKCGVIQQSTVYHKQNRNELGLRERDELELQSLSGDFRSKSSRPNRYNAILIRFNNQLEKL